MSVPVAYAGVILIWSTTPLAIKWSGEGVNFLFGVTGRMVIGLAAGLLLMWLLRQTLHMHRKVWPAYIAVGSTLYVAMMSVYFGAQYVPSGLVSVLFGLTPIFTALIALLWLKENNFSPIRVIGMLLGVLGLYVIFHDAIKLGDNALIGVAAILLAVIMHSFGSIWYKMVHVEELSSLGVTIGGLVVSLPLFTCTWLLLDGVMPEEIPNNALGSMVYLGIFGSVVGAMLFFYSLRQLGAMKMSLLTLITPLIALFIGFMANDELISPSTMMGTLIIILGLVLFQCADIRSWRFRLR